MKEKQREIWKAKEQTLTWKNSEKRIEGTREWGRRVGEIRRNREKRRNEEEGNNERERKEKRIKK